MKEKLKELKLTNFIALFFAGIINAIGVTLFLFPVKLYDSGISGLSMLLDQVTPSFMKLSLFLVVLNIPIFLFGLKKQGLVFTLYSIFAVSIYSLASFLITDVLPIDVSMASPLAENDLLLCAIFGGVISGVGSGLVIRFGGAIDGIDVLSVIFAKKLNLSIGAFVMIFNATLYIICGIVIQSWILPLYSIVTYFVGSKTVDFIVEGFDKSKCAMIVTSKAEEVTKAINESFKSSGTLVDAVGGYTKEKKNMIYLIINRFQINKLKQVVMKVDDKAFISLLEVTDVIRQNTIKIEKKENDETPQKVEENIENTIDNAEFEGEKAKIKDEN